MPYAMGKKEGKIMVYIPNEVKVLVKDMDWLTDNFGTKWYVQCAVVKQGNFLELGKTD